jgi:predicted phosphoadenosine phosphosulfate sulfurtransferase
MTGKTITETRVSNYVYKWTRQGYEGCIPQESPPTLEENLKAPSYRMIVKALLKNDLLLISLGYGKLKSNTYSTLKKIEIGARK